VQVGAVLDVDDVQALEIDNVQPLEIDDMQLGAPLPDADAQAMQALEIGDVQMVHPCTNSVYPSTNSSRNRISPLFRSTSVH